MSCLELLTQLACSMFFWPATFHCLGLDTPKADLYLQQAPAYPPAQELPYPIHRGYDDRRQLVGFDFEQVPTPGCYPQPVLSKQPCQLCPVPCYQAQPAAPMDGGAVSFTLTPVSCCNAQPALCPVPFQVPKGPAPNAYDVQVRLNPDSEKTCLCPRVSMLEGSDAIVSIACLDSAGNPSFRKLHLHLGKASGDCVPVHFEMTTPDGNKSCEKLAVEQAVHFNTVTGLVLGGNSPEPCLAEMVVSPSKACPAPPVCLPPPIPAAPKAVEMVAHVQPPPPPAPVGYSPEYRPAAPMLWRKPVEPTPVSYVPCPPAGYIPASMPQPGCVPYPPVMLTSIPVPANPPVLPPIAAKVYRLHRTSNISIVHESGKAKLQVMKDGVCCTASRMKFGTEEAGCLRLAAGKQYVHLTGKAWKASADHVEMYDDGRLVLTGHVKVVSDKVGVCSSLKGQRVCLRVKNGKVEKISGSVFSR
jgi:hypothetical protein